MKGKKTSFGILLRNLFYYQYAWCKRIFDYDLHHTKMPLKKMIFLKISIHAVPWEKPARQKIVYNTWLCKTDCQSISISLVIIKSTLSYCIFSYKISSSFKLFVIWLWYKKNENDHIIYQHLIIGHNDYYTLNIYGYLECISICTKRVVNLFLSLWSNIHIVV